MLDTPLDTLKDPTETRMVSNLLMGRPHSFSVIMALSTILFTASISMMYWRDFRGVTSLLAASGQSVIELGEWWRIFTTMFVHADIGHLLSNLYMLSIFSYFVYGYFGFFVFPLFSVFGAGIVNWIAISTYPPQVQLIGASGLVYLLGGLWLTLYFYIQRQYRILNRLLRVLGFALTIFGPTSFVPTTSYRTHLIGFILGVVLGNFYFIFNKNEIRSHEKYQEI